MSEKFRINPVVIKYVQGRCFGAAIDALHRRSPDNFQAILNRLCKQPGNIKKKRTV